MRSSRLLLVFVLAVAGPLAALADSAIKVIVNDQAITTFDIAQRLKLMQISREPGGQKEATDQLINEVLEIAEAKAHGVEAAQSRVDAAYASIAQNMKLSAGGLDKALGSAGIVPDTLKRRIKAQMVWGQVVSMKARYQVSVKSSDITAALFSEKPDQKEVTEYTLQDIIFVVPKGSSGAYSEQRRHEAEAFRLRYTGCDNAMSVAKGLKDVTIRMLGRRSSSDLSDKDRDDIDHAGIGKATPPRSTDNGIELIGICDAKKVGGGDDDVRAAVEDKLLAAKSKNVGTDYLKELRDKAIIVYR